MKKLNKIKPKMKPKIKRESFYLYQFNHADCEKFVLDKQINIYNNIILKNFSLAKTNQKYLVKSKQACYLSVKRVCTNKGGVTTGIDDFIPKRRKDYMDLIDKLYNLKSDNYKSSPLKRIWLPKALPSKDLRPISIPTIFDRCIQALWSLALDPVNEALSDDHNFGFRKGRSPVDAMRYTRDLLRRDDGPEYILEVDVAKGFDSIDHNYILNNIMVNHKILKQWLECGVMDSKQFYYDESGVPQGGIISPIICNLVLNGFEHEIKNNITIWVKNNILTKEQVKYLSFCRFADDMIIMAKSSKVLYLCKDLLTKFLDIRGLRINENKTRITYIQDGFKFVGYYFKRFPYQNPVLKVKNVARRNGNLKTKEFLVKGKLLVSVPPEKVKKFLSKLKTEIKTSKNSFDLVYKINPIIRGFSNFYRFGNWGLNYPQLNHRLYKTVTRWIIKKYKISNKLSYKNYLVEYHTFRFPFEQSWFENTSIKKRKRYKNDYIELYLPGKYPKIGAFLINKDSKPYYNRDKYFEHLERKARNFASGKIISDLLKKGNYRCLYCQTSLVEDNKDYEVHHLKPIEFGGKNIKSNYTLLCKVCHKYVTGVQKSRSLNEALDLVSKGILKIPNEHMGTFQPKQFQPLTTITHIEDELDLSYERDEEEWIGDNMDEIYQ